MSWIVLPIYDGVLNYPDRLVNLDHVTSIVDNDGTETCTLHGEEEMTTNIPFTDLKQQFAGGAGGVDLLGNGL